MGGKLLSHSARDHSAKTPEPSLLPMSPSVTCPFLSLMRPHSPHPVPLAVPVSSHATATQLPSAACSHAHSRPPRHELCSSPRDRAAFEHRKETSNSRALFLLNLPSAFTSWSPKLLASWCQCPFLLDCSERRRPCSWRRHVLAVSAPASPPAYSVVELLR
jgi:hypothetical protein|uniref:Uncharacterized protein n=1 Tax=Zea mays TaxID=4577 RepID=A0A804QIT1_MAIZE